MPCVDPKFDPSNSYEYPGRARGWRQTTDTRSACDRESHSCTRMPQDGDNDVSVVAPVGTFTPIEFALQKVGVAAVPLNVTVLEP